MTMSPRSLLQCNPLIEYEVVPNLDRFHKILKKRDAYIWGGSLQIKEFNIDDEFPCQRNLKCPNKIFVVLDFPISNHCKYSVIRKFGDK